MEGIGTELGGTEGVGGKYHVCAGHADLMGWLERDEEGKVTKVRRGGVVWE